MAAISLLARGAALFGVIAVVAFIIFEKYSNNLPLHIAGHVESGFERVKLAFEQNFIDGWEKGGASLAVYHDGKKVVDLWGGYADRASLRKWKEDTIQVVFSSTKGVGAVCVAMLVDRGYVSYDDLVTKHWPEFGQNGKDNVTVQMLISHASGLAYLDESIPVEDAMDHRKISALIEKQKPHWPPGTATAYHILTQGYLLDQLIRRVDPKHRSIGQFFREELHDAHGVDFHIGLPDEEMGRVARIALTTVMDIASEIMNDWRILKLIAMAKNLATDSMVTRAMANLPWFQVFTRMTLNDPDLWKIEQAAGLGIGNARSLAKIFALLEQKKVVSQTTIDLLQVYQYDDVDLMLGIVIAKGNGMAHTPVKERKASSSLIGHEGHGCQQAMVDFGNGLAMGYTTNALKTGMGGLCRTWNRLQTTIYDSLDL